MNISIAQYLFFVHALHLKKLSLIFFLCKCYRQMIAQYSMNTICCQKVEVCIKLFRKTLRLLCKKLYSTLKIRNHYIYKMAFKRNLPTLNHHLFRKSRATSFGGKQEKSPWQDSAKVNVSSSRRRVQRKTITVSVKLLFYIVQ